MSRPRLRSVIAVVAGVATATIAGLVGVAAAHVSVSGDIAPGESGTVTFTVPNERDDASTTRLEVKIPDDVPLGSLRVKPKPGWTVDATTRPLDEPIEVFGRTVTDVVDTIVWQAEGPGIAPEQYDTFEVRGGPFPDAVDSVAFPTIQTYSSGEEVDWIEVAAEGGEEPEHPAPVLTLAAAEDPADSGGALDESGGGSPSVEGAADQDADPDDGLAAAGLVAGVLGIGVGGLALTRTRRRP